MHKVENCQLEIDCMDVYEGREPFYSHTNVHFLNILMKGANRLEADVEK